jgi:outer membrane protein insertion porin family
MKKAIYIIIIVIFSNLLPLIETLAQQLPIVTEIEIKGLKRIEKGSILTKISQKIGEPLSTDKTASDIKTIYKMGYFDDVKVEIEPFEGGIKVIYVVKEKPTIISIQFSGNKKFEDSTLKEKITLTTGAIADITLINDNAIKLRKFYEEEGYYLAKVYPILRTIKEGEISVTYQIEEGDKVKIKRINIHGNKALSEGKIKKVMKTKERGLFSFVLGTGFYKKEEISADIERIKDLYHNNGFIKVTVAEPEIKLSDDKKSMFITINISEGEQYKVSSVNISGNKAFSVEEIKKRIKILPKTIFNKEILKKDITAITDLYSNNGYALVSVYPDLTPDENTKETTIVYRIEEGDKYFIGRIEISGNTKTRDKVIRREVRVDEGDVFDASALKRSYERINNLQFFEAVELTPKPDPDKKIVDLDIKVKEKPTGFLSIGGGYSSVDKFIAMADITQANLFGKGQYIKLRGELGGRSSFYEISFRDPYFMDKPLSFGASIYNTTRKYANFDRKSSGFEISFGKNFWEYWGASISYNYEKTTISNIETGASNIVREQEGTRTTSSISLSFGRDSRDNIIDPLSGSKNVIYTTFAGLGGTNAFYKINLDSGWYFPLFDVTTIHLRGRVGYATGLFGKNLPLYERYYVGGIYTVRGLNYGDAGPKDINDEPIGGTKQLILNAEYIFPIASELKLKGILFFDAGRSYGAGETFGSDLRYTAGTGIRWISPMGPIRVEWGYNLDKRAGEPSSKVEFTFGTFF